MGRTACTEPQCLYKGALFTLPIVQEAGLAAGQAWTGAGNLAYTGIQLPNRPARSESLY